MFTEGTKTEESYLLPWRRSYRGTVLVSVDPFHGPPMELVKRAAGVRKQELREEERGRGRAHDEIWCLFDVDAHARLPEARRKAAENGIHLAISNPCIELWFVLHFVDQAAFIDRHDVQKAAGELLGCRKNLTVDAQSALFDRFDAARERAIRLDEKHAGDGSPGGSNPSSSVWRLIDSIRR